MRTLKNLFFKKGPSREELQTQKLKDLRVRLTTSLERHKQRKQELQQEIAKIRKTGDVNRIAIRYNEIKVVERSMEKVQKELEKLNKILAIEPREQASVPI